MSPELALLEVIMASLEVVTKGGEILRKARSEGRTVTQAELDSVKADNAVKRAAWDAGND